VYAKQDEVHPHMHGTKISGIRIVASGTKENGWQRKTPSL
jgi:hypothetical protein